jgi:hypothetical protein
MEIMYRVTNEEARQARAFFEKWSGDPFVVRRRERNIENKHCKINKTEVWEAIITCLLTTQQRSGPESAVNEFINTKPFPVSLKECLKYTDCSDFVREQISRFGGLRRSKTIGIHAARNLNWLDNGGWAPLLLRLRRLELAHKAKEERLVANFVAQHLVGFGPKQSRNLLQSLGLTRYETPLDSRITKWLNIFGFPVRLTASGLADQGYYEFVSDAFQALCSKVGVLPCLMDAAIFASFDKGAWSPDKVRW